jgi:hypothetical protein
MARKVATFGTLVFSPIAQLPDKWWTDLDNVWSVWDPNAHYLWGANSGNYSGIAIGGSLNGRGMAGANGPTRGRAHPNYVGIITMDAQDMPLNDSVFDRLEEFLRTGKNVVVPTQHLKLSLGTGIGATAPDWDQIQSYLLKKIHQLGMIARNVDIPEGTYWPDCRRTPPVRHVITKLTNLSDIVRDEFSEA